MTAVVGVGNPTMGDDGLGRAVVDRLEDDPALSVRFAGTTAMFALEALDGADRAIVADAVEAADGDGTIHRFELGGEGPGVTMHDFTVSEAVETCAGVYDLPSRVVVVGAVPANIEPRIGLSDRLEAVLPALTTAIHVEATHTHETLGEQFVNAQWYCVDCETTIDADAVDQHERQGHSVRGRLQPERLLSQRPAQQSGEH